MRGAPIFADRCVRPWNGAHAATQVPRGAGYTVIEVLIVLAVTAALFVSAAVMISGRQNQTAFDQATRQIQSQIQQVLNEVAAGHYPATNDFRCSAAGAGATPSLTAGAAGQGTNSGCIFLGRAMQFGVGTNDPDQFSTYTIAGNQRGASGEAATLAEARPMVVARSTPSHSNPAYPDNSVDELLQSGLKAVRMWYSDGGSDVEIGALAFVNSLAQFDGSGQVVSGAGSVSVVAVDGTSLHAAKGSTVELMNSDGGNRIATGNVNPSNGVFVCFEGGTAQDYAIIKIGGDSRELSIVLTTKDKESATCTYP
jgi:type II secretory pathway pseudopilin PulG